MKKAISLLLALVFLGSVIAVPISASVQPVTVSHLSATANKLVKAEALSLLEKAKPQAIKETAISSISAIKAKSVVCRSYHG